MALLAVAVLISVTNLRGLFALILSPDSSLVLVIEVNHEQRMFELNEEVPWVLIVIIFCFGQVYAVVFVSMCQIDFIFKLFPGIFYREILHTKIRSEVFTSFDSFDVAFVFHLRIRFAERSRSTTLIRLR